MEEHVTKSAHGLAAQPVPKRNAGWFKRSDSRINREGRPRGSSKIALKDGSPTEDRARHADRLMLVFIPMRVFRTWLRRIKGACVVNLPNYEIVGCRFDAARDGVLLHIRSQSFPRVAQGALLPEFTPEWEGLAWVQPNC